MRGKELKAGNRNQFTVSKGKNILQKIFGFQKNGLSLPLIYPTQ
jgi:hypothetical protein